MGTRGPVPKRSDQRRRENKPEIPYETAPGASSGAIPNPDTDWHPIAKLWFESLAESGQSYWYQPSDWAEAFFLAHVMSEALTADTAINGPKLSAMLAGASRLMTTEGDRRRLRIELERPDPVDSDEAAAVIAIAKYQQQLA